MNNGIGRVWAVNAEGGNEGRPNGVGPVIIENIDKLGGGLPDPSGASEGDVLTVDAQGEPAWEPPTGGGIEYSAGNGIDIDSSHEISIDTSVVATQSALSGKQDALTAGANIQLNGSTISATDTTYTAGNGLTLSSGAFSVDTTVVATQSDVSAIRQVPSAAAADEDKVLGVTDAQGSVGWVTPPSGVDVHVISCENLNPLGLPPKTIRMRFVDTTYNPSTSLSTSDYSFSLVDASTDTWDITLNDNKPYIGNDISYDASQGYEVLDLNWYGIENASNLFLGAQALLSANITSFKNVKNLAYSFNGCSNLTSLTLGHLEDVENMESMCTNCAFTTAPDLSSLRNVESMNQAFAYCQNLVSVPDLPLEHMPHVVNVNYMFAYCYNVESGALSLYQRMAQYISGADHYGVFESCGSNTASGEQDLNQIPTSWGGNA